MIDVIIPAHNEDKTIGTLVETFYDHPWIHSVIVACDNCTDGTALSAILHGAGITINKEFGGKGQAVTAALKYVVTEYVMFCDGDLTGLIQDHITRMAERTMEEPRLMTIGVPEIPGNYPTERIWAWPWVSGQRCVPTALVRPLDLHGYLMEVQINEAAKRTGLPVRHVWLPGLKSEFDMSERRLAEMERDAQWGHAHGILP